jgi:hypothetical protein
MKLLLLPVFLCLLFPVFAQNSSKKLQMVATKTEEKIKTDGNLIEDSWLSTQEITGFVQNFPTDSLNAKEQTFVKMLFDQKNIYISLRVEYQYDKNFTISSLRRDFEPSLNNCVAIILDPFSDGLNGFAFIVSPLGVASEALLSDGDKTNFTWDNRWTVHTGKGENFWTAEIEIPLKTIRYPKGSTEWKANFIHYNISKNEISSWQPVPQNFSLINLAFSGKIIFDGNLPKAGLNLAFIPFLTGSMSQKIAEGKPTESKADAGFDAKIALTPALNLDITVNPDFSQVEADRQVTNLDRFEIFFPERRQFFIENSDLYTNIGFSRLRPFFSRRIGIGFDTVTRQIVQNRINYGLRLSGKIAAKTRLALMNMQTAKDENSGIAAQNYTAAVIQQQILSRSSISFVAVNREKFGVKSDDLSRYSRLFGLDYIVQSSDNKWTGKLFYHRAVKPEDAPDAHTHAGWILRRTKNWNFAFNYEYAGKNYDINDIGYVARRGHWRWEWWCGYYFYSKEKSKIFRHGPNIYHNVYQDHEFFTTDQNFDLSYRVELKNTSYYSFGYFFDWVYLFFPFDPTNSGGAKLPEGSKYMNNGIYGAYTSDRRKNFTFYGDISFRNYYGGVMSTSSFGGGYRFQPYGSASVAVDYNNIDLPAPYKSADFWLVGPRLDISFSKSVFLTTFMQYNQQAENVNLNMRFQWRFAPVSDLFIVYTDNYLPQNFNAKSRAIVFKLTYWLNI